MHAIIPNGDLKLFNGSKNMTTQINSNTKMINMNK